MDKNSVFGLLIIGGILIGWMYLTKPTQQELAKQQLQYDSVAKFEKLILQENENVSGKIIELDEMDGDFGNLSSTAPLFDLLQKRVSINIYNSFI